jgi:hypothetical protein
MAYDSRKADVAARRSADAMVNAERPHTLALQRGIGLAVQND